MRSDGFKVVWTRGRGCHELASVLSDDDKSARLQGDLVDGCIDARADLLISKKFPGSFDLVNVAVPIGFEPERVRNVVAAVAGGPNSILVAETALRISHQLGVEAEMISAASSEEEARPAAEVLSQIGVEVPGINRRVVQVDGISELVEELEEETLLVLGESGGSWLSRSRTGPGAKLRRTAQAGAIVVRSAPDRVFRFMDEPIYVAPLRQADDTLRMHSENTLAVAEEGRLVGLVRRQGLVSAGQEPVESVMEEAISVRVDETMLQAWDLEPTFGPDPIPVTDHDENLVGGLSLSAG